MSKPPSLQVVKTRMEISKAYRGIFPEIFLTATVRSCFSQMKIVKICLRNRLSDINLARHMCIVIEGPELTSVIFNEIFGCTKSLYCIIYGVCYYWPICHR